MHWIKVIQPFCPWQTAARNLGSRGHGSLNPKDRDGVGNKKKRGTTSNRRNRNHTTITTVNYKDQRWEQKQQVQHLRNTTITTIITTISSNNIEDEPYSLSFNDSRQVSQIELRLCIIAWRRDLGPESCTSWIWTREDGKLIKNIWSSQVMQSITISNHIN